MLKSSILRLYWVNQACWLSLYASYFGSRIWQVLM